MLTGTFKRPSKFSEMVTKNSLPGICAHGANGLPKLKSNMKITKDGAEAQEPMIPVSTESDSNANLTMDKLKPQLAKKENSVAGKAGLLSTTTLTTASNS